MRQIVLDTETTGLQYTDGHRIIEIGCLELINRRFTGKKFHYYLNPQREVEEGALSVHGITNQFLQDKPLFQDIVIEFMEFINGAELIIHNAPFDTGFINHELSLTKQKWRPLESYCRVIDTLILARKRHVGQRNSLDALCKRYNVDNSNREFHGALLDAHLLSQVYLSMTGGQGALFDEIVKHEDNKNEVLSVDRTLKPRNLIVLKANQEELQAHEAHLQMLSKNGKCVWSVMPADAGIQSKPMST